MKDCCHHGMLFPKQCCSICRIADGDEKLAKIVKLFEPKRPKIYINKEEKIIITKKVST